MAENENNAGMKALVFSRRFRLDVEGNLIYAEDYQSHNEDPDALRTLQDYNRALANDIPGEQEHEEERAQ